MEGRRRTHAPPRLPGRRAGRSAAQRPGVVRLPRPRCPQYVARRLPAGPAACTVNLLLLLHARTSRRPHVRRVHGNGAATSTVPPSCSAASSRSLASALDRPPATVRSVLSGALRRCLQRRPGRGDRRRGAWQLSAESVVRGAPPVTDHPDRAERLERLHERRSRPHGVIRKALSRQRRRVRGGGLPLARR